MVNIKLEDGHTCYKVKQKYVIEIEMETQFYPQDIISILARELHIDGVKITFITSRKGGVV